MKLPDALTAIEEEAFCGMPFMQRIVLPDNVTSIGRRAFAQMTALYQLVLPEGIKEIAADVVEDTDCVILCSADTADTLHMEELDLPYALIE